MKLPEYRLREDHMILTDMWDIKTVPKGSFVKPLSLNWVPKHVLEKHPFFDPNNEIFVYCKFGIVSVYKNKIEEIKY